MYFVYDTACLELMIFIKGHATVHLLAVLLATVLAGENISALSVCLQEGWECGQGQPAHRALLLPGTVIRFIT